MTAALLDVITDWFAAFRAQPELLTLDLEPEDEFFDSSLSPLEEFR